MSKAVLISIRPKWCEKIISGEKTVELRKTRPQMEPPFRCYIYCTIDGIKKMPRDYITETFARGKVIGEFTCVGIERIAKVGYTGIIERYRYKKIQQNNLNVYDATDLFEAACLPEADVEEYLKGRVGYGWRISNLKIYEKPFEVSDFSTCPSERLLNVGYESSWPLRKVPQDWRYVNERV